VLAGLAVLIVAGAIAFALFRPDTLFTDRVANEQLAPEVEAAIEGPAPPTTATMPTTAPPGAPTATVVATGMWQSLRHDTRGDVAIVDVDGDRTLVFRDLDSDNGPDLYVYLSPAEPSDDADFLAGATKVGGLKGNIGTQVYELPPDLDLSAYRSVVIWCDRFSVPFGAAALQSV
jgi:hypothetical protein